MDIIALKLSFTNDYLFRNGDSWVLVDTGYAEDRALLERRLAEAGVAISDISHLILTHHHDDHAGLLNWLVARNPQIAVVMSTLSRELLLSRGARRILPAHGKAFPARLLERDMGKNRMEEMVAY